MLIIKNTMKYLVLPITMILFLSACGSSSSNSGASGESSDTGSSVESATTSTQTASNTDICTGAQIQGTWRLTASAAGVTESQDVQLPNEDTPRTFSDTIDGISLDATLNGECNRFEGTFSDASLGISGTVVGVKL